MTLSMEAGLGPGHNVLDGAELPSVKREAEPPQFLAHGGVELGPHLTQCVRAEAHAKFHLDPSKRLATVHQRYRQIDRTTVLLHLSLIHISEPTRPY